MRTSDGHGNYVYVHFQICTYTSVHFRICTYTVKSVHGTYMVHVTVNSVFTYVQAYTSLDFKLYKHVYTIPKRVVHISYLALDIPKFHTDMSIFVELMYHIHVGTDILLKYTDCFELSIYSDVSFWFQFFDLPGWLA